MSKTVELARHLETLHINNMYKTDFYWTWDKTDQFKVFFYVFRLVAAFAVEVETGVNALGNAAVPAEKGMPVRRQVGCEVKIDHIFKHCFIPRFRLRPD